MKKNYDKLDTNGDGTLDYDELKNMLKQGNPTFTDDECRRLYEQCDSNHDGKISFQEFLAYIYKAEHTDAGRHARLEAGARPQVDDSEIAWTDCEMIFHQFAGKDGDLDGREFAKFCHDCNLYSSWFKKVDVDIIFSKVVPKGKRRMNFSNFQDACRLIAQKRGCPNRVVQELIGNSSGPQLVGTKAEKNRFHDDKSAYTGSHAHNEKIEGTDPNAALGRHERLQEQHARQQQNSLEDPWDDVERTFRAFAGSSGDLDGKEFLKMCTDIPGLVRGGFVKQDIDVIFTSVAGGLGHRIQFEAFKQCVRDISRKKDEDCCATQACIARSKGPTIHATKAEYNRFHDDKNSYTGVQGQR